MTVQSKPNTDDLRIKEIKELVPPAHVFREFPVGVPAAQTTFSARQAIHRILHGADDRLLARLELFPAVSENPNLAFDIEGAGPTRLTLRDTSGTQFEAAIP